MQDLDIKKKALLEEILDLDNKRIERDFILKSIDELKKQQVDIKVDVDVEKAKLAFEIGKREMFERQKNIDLEKREERVVDKEREFAAKMLEHSHRVKEVEAAEQRCNDELAGVRTATDQNSKVKQSLEKKEQELTGLMQSIEANRLSVNTAIERARSIEARIQERRKELDGMLASLESREAALIADKHSLGLAESACISKKAELESQTAAAQAILATILSEKKEIAETLRQITAQTEAQHTKDKEQMIKERSLQEQANAVETAKLELQVKERELNRRERVIIAKEKLKENVN